VRGILVIRVLFDVVHPADVHFFKNVIGRLLARGDEVIVTSRRKDITVLLLDELGISHRVISTKGKTPLGLFVELVYRDWELWKIADSFNPHVFVSNNSPCGAHVAWLKSKPSLVFDDTEIHRFNRYLYYPFVTEVHTPDCYRLRIGKKQRRYPGYHVLAYLHPNHFTPDVSVLKEAGIRPEEKYVVMRFVEWGAMHDVGVNRMTLEAKKKIILTVGSLARVIISAESPLPEELESYRINLDPVLMRHLMAFASLVIAESATMCSEAAVLGIPALYVDDTGRGYTDEKEVRYGICRNFPIWGLERVIDTAKNILSRDSARREFLPMREKMLSDKIDVACYQLNQIDRLADP